MTGTMWIRWGWRQLTSMRTALLLLMLLAVAAVPGSVFPQRRIDPSRVAQYLADHHSSGPLLDRLGFFDVYSSPWFSAVYLLLFISLVGCVLPRSRHHWTALRARPPRTPSRLSRLPAHSSLTVDADPEAVLAAARNALRRRRYRIAECSADGQSPSLAAEKGYLAETGNLVFHFALLGLLVAVATGSFIGYSGQAIIVSGQQFSNTVPLYSSFQAGSRVATGALAPFSFRIDDLTVKFEESTAGSQLGAPRDFTARLTVRDSPSAAPRTVTVKVNDPLDVDGARVFLVGNGYAPVVTVRDGTGAVAWSGPVPFAPQDGNYRSLGVIKVPDAKPLQLALQGFFLPTARFDPTLGAISVFPDTLDPRLVMVAYVSAPGQDGLGVDTGVPQSVYVLDTRHLTKLTAPAGSAGSATGEPFQIVLQPGGSVQLPDAAGSVTFDGIRRFAALDIRYDPTKGWALVAAVLALTGVTLSLFVRRRRVWVSATLDDAGRTVVEVAGLARGDDAGLAGEVQSVLDATGMKEQ